MKRTLALAILAALFVFPGAGRTQQAITIKLKERGAGEAAEIKKNETTSSKVTVTDAGGNVIVDQREIKGEIQEFKETFLAREAGKQPTKIERAYSKAQTVKDDQASDSPLNGKTVIITKKGDKYEFTFKGGESVTGQAAASLTKDFSKKSDANAELEKLVLPAGPVKVGDSWKIDMPKIVAELAKQGPLEMDGGKSTGQGTFVKAYKKDGRQFGEMKFKLDMPLVTIGKGKEELKFTAGAKIHMDLTFDACIVGTSEAGTLKMKMKMTGDASVAGAPGATATLDVTVDAVQIQQDAKK